MSRTARRQIAALLGAAIVLAAGIFLAIKISHHSQNQAIPTGAQPTVTYGQPTVVGTTPGETAPSAGAAVQDQGSYAIPIPAGSSQINSVGGDQHELRFSVDNRYSVDVQSQPLHPGETFEDIATLYGTLGSAERIGFGGHRGLLFKNVSGGYTTWTAVGVKGRVVYTLQTYGPSANAQAARKLITHLASSTTLKQS